MKTYPEIMTENKVNESFDLSVTASEVIAGLFIIHPVGSINTNTYPILKKEMEWIFESRPEIILFDMKQVKYVNLRGLRVILKTFMEMNQRSGKVYLMNLQPEIKEMFEVMNGALPEWVFGSRKQLEIYLDAIHNNFSGNRRCKMDKGLLINLVNTVSEDHLKIDAIRRLGTYINDSRVLDVLCREAVETDRRHVRDASIRTLKGNSEEANRRFSRIAICAKNPTHRRWALITLSLMECCYAKEAVMQGLRDTHRSVRFAAAFNAGLYYDSDVVNALELFFERNRFLLVLDGLCQAGKPLLPLIKKVKEKYRDYYRHDDTKGEEMSMPGSPITFG
jgi:anti-anti-sigma factor